METLTYNCTCDDIGDDPCPAHYRENALQDLVIELRNNEVAYRHDIEVLEYENRELHLQLEELKKVIKDLREYIQKVDGIIV